MGDEDGLYSVITTLTYAWRGFYIGAVGGGVLCYLCSEHLTDNSTLDTLIGIGAGGLVGVAAGLGVRVIIAEGRNLYNYFKRERKE